MKFIKEYSGVVALVILAITGIAPMFASQSFAGTGTRFPNGVSANNTSPVAGQLLGTTLTVTGAATLSSALGFVSTAGTSNVQFVSKVFSSATTTPCALQNPSSTATSTVENLVFNVTTATSTSYYGQVSTSTTAFATTSALVTSWPIIGAGAQGTWVMSQATTTPYSQPIVGPSGWVVFSTMASSTGLGSNGIATLGGNCEGTFQTVF